ncbi:type III-B CRISPR module RAMP protein Cmr4 [Porphyromonas gulae]|uniref:type III-B CRISPR module RAMP protein Cmr4 n=1 Tax=Porphyromonas gulae TaxID=111105 RepID=UPI00052D91D1|nr:type III-B CRISPR module RAMP protein Cmr4 [Porphyromonas gulae]KGN89239.1 CRISPR-associated protein Cmr4 [Porphyromonas gulae]
MKTATYVIRCLTNMHVGKGDATYEVVDKCVQRDVTTGVPCIYSSSLKGALRQFFSKQGFTELDYVFGADVNRDKKNNSNENNEEEHSIGNFTFFQANLLAYPVQTTQEGATYILKTNKTLQEPITELANLLSAPSNIEALLPKGIEKDLSNEALEQLPVIARNKLENGKSENLWYEEVVPAESRFVFFVSYDNEEIFAKFDKIIQEKVIQIGANGSIGYGFCKVTNVK